MSCRTGEAKGWSRGGTCTIKETTTMHDRQHNNSSQCRLPNSPAPWLSPPPHRPLWRLLGSGPLPRPRSPSHIVACGSAAVPGRRVVARRQRWDMSACTTAIAVFRFLNNFTLHPHSSNTIPSCQVNGLFAVTQSSQRSPIPLWSIGACTNAQKTRSV